MYDDSTLNKGQFSIVRGNLVRVTKSNPCPHCGKPDWCYFIGELSVCNRDQPPATGWEATSKADKDGKTYYARSQEKKPVRSEQTRYWEYPEREGNALIRVRRIDFGDGRKKDIKQQHWDKNKKDWVTGYGSVTRDSIPIYRYAEVREAIAQDRQIFLVDGEQCADILWEFNLAATTSIGGMGKFSLANSMDLQGAQVVIVPDRDEPGLKDADKAAQHFPEVMWLYPFPESKAWENLPKSDGLDIFDWIDQEKLGPSDIRAAIGEKKVFKAPASQAAANIVRPPQFQIPPISELEGEIDNLLDSDLKKSQLRIKISELAQKYRLNSGEVRKIYDDREQEREQEASEEDTKIRVEQLLASKSASVKLSEIFPESLATPIEIVATRMNLKPECYALALITGTSRFIKNGSSTMLVEEWNRYRCRTFGYIGVLIAESSQMKTPVMNAAITDPLMAMREKNQKKFDAEKKIYAEEMEQWKNSNDEDKGPPPDAPVEKIPYITKATWEGIAGMVGRNPTQGILWLCDELAGFFKSANQYRSGKGSDKEDLLECWSGNGAVVARAAGTTVNVGAVSLSIYGNIQPKVLAPFLGDGSDDNGTIARFEFVQQPPALTQITLGLPKIDINPMLEALYEKLDTIPVTEFALDEEAKQLFVDYYNRCQRLRLNHPQQGMRAMLGKAAEKVGRVATILHCIHASHLGMEVSQKIPASQVVAAIKWVEYTTQQALSINIEVCSPDALDGNLAKIISMARASKTGSVTAREFLATCDSKYRPTPQAVREWFAKLESMKHGEVTEKGRSIRFSISTTSTTSTNSHNPFDASITGVEVGIHVSSTTSTFSGQKSQILGLNVEERGGNVEETSTPSNAYVDKGYSSNVEVVEVFPSSPKTSESLLVACTTKPEEFAEQIRSAIANIDQPLAIQILNALKGKAKEKLKEEVRSCLTIRENENFRLLVVAGLLLDMRVKYVGDAKYAEQYEGLELEVDAMDKFFQITCRKPDGYLTTRMKPEELQRL
jgi:CRISPR-associated protein Cmr3